MNRLTLGTWRAWQRGMALAFFAFVTLPTLAWAQDSTGTASSHSSQTTTTTTTTSVIADWRLWVAVGAVLLVIVIIALSRGRGESNTTIVK